MSVFAVAYYDAFGHERPLYTLGHDTLFAGPAAELLTRTGVIRATHENAAAALAAGAVVMVFPGGDYDVIGLPSKRTSLASAAGADT
jgi:1-acyl-sn-glycerol-3-phosphate acyltransferase